MSLLSKEEISNLNPDSLAHYGIPGMKRGVRRWQYEDGRFNEEGKIRYFGTKNPRNTEYNGIMPSDTEKSIINISKLRETINKLAERSTNKNFREQLDKITEASNKKFKEIKKLEKQEGGFGQERILSKSGDQNLIGEHSLTEKEARALLRRPTISQILENPGNFKFAMKQGAKDFKESVQSIFEKYKDYNNNFSKKVDELNNSIVKLSDKAMKKSLFNFVNMYDRKMDKYNREVDNLMKKNEEDLMNFRQNRPASISGLIKGIGKDVVSIAKLNSTIVKANTLHNLFGDLQESAFNSLSKEDQKELNSRIKDHDGVRRYFG